MELIWIRQFPILYCDTAWRERVRVALEIVLTDEERAELTRLVHSRLTRVRLAQRAHIALLAADGARNKDIIAQCQQRHRHVEWLKFLRKVDRETPKVKTLHLLADNYDRRKSPGE